MSELKPCPMCGGSPNKPAKNGGSDERSGYNFTVTVACKCGLRIDRASHQNKQGWCNDSGQAEAETLAAWNRRAQPEPAASADPSRDAYEGCREDLLDWKRRALKAEETCRQLTRALGEDVNGTTFMGEPVLPPRDAAPSVAPEPVAWRYQDARGHYRYRAYKPGFDVEYAILKPVPLYEAHPPRAPLTRETLAEIVRSHLTSTYHCVRVWEAWHVGTMTEDDFEPASESDMAEDIADAILAAHPPRAPSVAPEPVAWEGGEGWESLAWELCADENGEDACNELIWEGGPIPEPWGDRWMKYEGEAKRLIALVHKHAAHPPRAPLPRQHIEERDNVAAFARLIEAAHGIRGQG